ncbi:MAG TPA: thiosulfohydrolase SoxB [Ideonella sp.]|uniref:thiosulfohydrolase SoxB n=1 Tax=Ideonella sp. TaxID=1929293 RepID=UPI002C5EDCD1|nr:thiosulfohydrolase SoxB [Ideonella sp.]HSI50330.1 thiosulfohydrolase SoxB [Ideonella sp.]
MNLDRREWLQALGAAALSGLNLNSAAWAAEPGGFYELPRFGNVSFLHMTDCHAQLLPLHYREPSVNLGVGAAKGQWPHLAGEAVLKAAGVAPGSAMAHALSCLDFSAQAQRHGEIGGFAHLATLVRQLRASRPGALLLDGGDSWQGSATALWTNGQDMVDACKLLGVDVMTGHWEFTLGAARVQEVVAKDFKGQIDFVAQNIASADFGDPVFAPYTLRQQNGVTCAVIGQAFPYTPVANPRYFVPDWTFGIQEAQLQQQVDALRAKGVAVVVLLSHNGMDVDLKLASRVRGLDAIFGGHTHDAVPLAVPVRNAGGTTLVTNAGSHGKFLGLMDFDVKDGRVRDFRYRLLPIFSRQLAPDPAMAALIAKLRAPYEKQLNETLAVTDGLLWRRGNFNGSWDQLICDALRAEQDAELAFSPGFRWGGSLLPGQAITRERLMDQLAITYPTATRTLMSGEQIKTVLEDVADNLFNPDPYYQQGGDMVRTGGLSWRCTPAAAMGRRIDELRVHGQPLQADKRYAVAGWASVSEEVKQAGGPPVWTLVERWLKRQPGGRVAQRVPDAPALVGVADDPGYSPSA